MDIVLIQPRRYRRAKSGRSQPQLGLAYIASYLISKGVDVAVIDAEVEELSVNDTVDRLLKYNPLAVGITTTTEDRFTAISIFRNIKQKRPEIFTIAGGPHFSYCAADALENVPEIDLVVIGEGEETCYQVLLRRLRERGGAAFDDISGIAVRKDGGEILITPKRTLISDLNILPRPAWELFPMHKYQRWLSVEEKTRAIGVISSRGCPYNCVFCCNAREKSVRYRDPVLFVDEVEELHRVFGFPGLNFQDDSFTANKKHAFSICEEIIKRRLNLRWYCSLRVDGVDRSLLQIMREAGCVALGFGLESGSDNVLKNIRKGISTDMIRAAIRMARDEGFHHISLFFMISLPGETLADIKRGSDFIHEMYSIITGMPSGGHINVGTPALVYPGTELERIARQNCVLSKEFSWNQPYKTAKASVFNSNPYVPHFENPGLPLEKIANFVKEFDHAGN